MQAFIELVHLLAYATIVTGLFVGSLTLLWICLDFLFSMLD